MYKLNLFKKIIKKIFEIIFSNQIFLRKLDDLKLQNGQIFSFFLNNKINSIKN
jgi:hypothetical protein